MAKSCFARLRAVIGVSCGLLLVACGGGGGGGGSDTPPPPPQTHSLSGTISAMSGTEVDSDINDPLAPYADNGTFALAQAIAAPVTVGGYANVATAGPAGRSTAAGDEFDWYRVDLQPGMRIALHVATDDPGANDLDLYLYASNGTTEIDSSIGTGALETLDVAEAGSYYIKVRAWEGGSNYTLNLGLASDGATATNALRMSEQFVPGEVVVKFKSDLLASGARETVQARAAAVALQAKAGGPGRAMLFSLGEGAARERALRSLGVERPQQSSNLSKQQMAQDKRDTLLAIKALRRRADVEYAEPNYLYQAHAVPNDGHYGLQWHYSAINLPQAWDISTGVRAPDPVIVAVIDTGVLLNHPDLAGVLVGGYDFIRSTAMSGDGDGIDGNPDDVGDATTGRSSFHGTHVAGTIAGATNNGIGVAGVSWGAKIMPLRVLGIGGGTSYDIRQAIYYAARLPNDSGTLPPKKADVINLSLGGGGSSLADQAVFNEARAAGLIVIASAGNENTSAPSYPASYDGVVSVSALDMNNNRAPYSNYGSKVDVAAPGGDTSVDLNADGYADGVLSTLGNDSDGAIRYTYNFYQGTSMSAPHVAGVAALMRAVAPNMSPAAFDAALADGSITHDMGTAGRDSIYGHGLIDAYKAVLKAQALAGDPETPLPPILAANLGLVSFGGASSAAAISLSNAGGGSLTVTAATDPVDWLSVSEFEVDATTKLGTYTVTVNRDGLADGTYRTDITFTSTSNTVIVPVVMQVSSLPAARNAGYHYILLVDAVTLDAVDQVDGGPTNGSYPFSFAEVPAGTYFIVAGTDANNDGYICDVGEACGSYESLSELVEISVGADLSGLDFATGFDQAFLTEASTDGSGSGIPLRRLPVRRELAR